MEAEPIAEKLSPETRVLIIEANEEHANLMRHGLQFHETPFQATFVSNLATARAFLEREKPSILISELCFSDGKLMELLPAEPETEHYPVVALTDQGSEKDAVDLLKAGILDYVVKTRRKCQEIGDLIEKSLEAWERIRDIRKAEMNLQQTLRLARSIMDSLPTPVGVLDEAGKLLSINEAWKSLSSDSPLFSEAINVGTDYIKYCQSLNENVGQQLAGLIQDVVVNQSVSQPLHFMTSGDHGVWFSVEVHPCFGSGRARAIVIYHDISDRKQLELSQSEREMAEQQMGQLTSRERQVMQLVVNGRSNKAIAESLKISVKTVEMHRSNLMKKLKLRNVTDLVKLAINAGSLNPEIELV